MFCQELVVPFQYHLILLPLILMNNRKKWWLFWSPFLHSTTLKAFLGYTALSLLIIFSRTCVVMKCQQCQLHQKVPTETPPHPWEWPSQPCSRVHIDYTGP